MSLSIIIPQILMISRGAEKNVCKNTINLRMDFFVRSAYNKSNEILRTVMNLELHRIGEEKLKVVLTPFDMMKYNLTCEKLDYENTETRKAIWNILDYAKHETGFDAAQGRICIEVFPEKNGGCSLYITKLKKSEDTAERGIDLSSAEPARISQTRIVYGFDGAESLLRVCRFLDHRGYTLPSRAFLETQPAGGCRYYLELCERASAQSTKKSRYLKENLFISEFGTRVESDGAAAFLTEHCIPLCEEDAVAALSRLSN